MEDIYCHRYTSVRMAKKIWVSRIKHSDDDDCIAVRSLIRRINQQKKIISAHSRTLEIIKGHAREFIK